MIPSISYELNVSIGETGKTLVVSAYVRRVERETNREL
jgi:hypothetical protein